MSKRIYSAVSLGCYADGTFGHQHVRNVLASMVEDTDEEKHDKDLVESLRGDMPDDASDEDEALDFLNQYTEENVFFDFVDGDLCLIELEGA